MAVSAVPGSLLGRIARDSAGIRTAFKARAARSPLVKHVLDVTALAVGDIVAFAHGFTTGGLAVMGSLILINYAIQDAK